MSTTHTITDFQPVPAPGYGGLPGYAATCACGSVISSSLETLTRQWAREHTTYYNRKENGA